MPTTNPAVRSEANQLEGLVLFGILLAVAAFAGAASFTHVKDWTLHNSPSGTGAWFGWANAVISELVPIAALLTIRRRRRVGAPVGYPMFLLIAAAGLSLAAQLAVAKPGPTGWLLSAVPALAFMALAKLVLAPLPGATENSAASVLTERALHTREVVNTGAVPATPHTDPATASRLDVPARFAIVSHQQTTGRPITVDELADRLDTTPAIAGQLLAAINPPADPPATVSARVNGASVLEPVR